ncbi:MAG: acetate--CoA ligase family protein [Patescibacteria group bacterium]
MSLEKLFDPKSVAVIGATPDKSKVGYALLYNLIQNKKRDIYPVTISAQEVLGLKAYPSVLNIPAVIDLALITVRADIVPQVLTDCGKKHIPFVIIISAGFKEAGADGKALEEKIKSIAKKYKITLLGPNCLGVINSESDLNASFATRAPLPGHIGFVSQSGALGSAILDWAISQGIGFSKFISLGNEAGLTELEFFKYLAKDKSTKAVLVYLEKVTDGEKFIQLVKNLTKQKPVVILKAGRSERGQAAVASHTGSLAPDDAIFLTACKSAGAVTVESIRELFTFAKLFHIGVFSPLKKLLILTNGGGPSIVTADLIDLSESLELAELSTKTKQALASVLPPMAATGNPVDILGDALSSRFGSALNILVNEKNIDGIILILTPQMMTEVEATAEIIISAASKKTILPIFFGGGFVEAGKRILKVHELTDFEFPKDIVEALDAFGVSKGNRKKTLPHPVAKNVPPKMAAYKAMEKLFRSYGIKLEGTLISSKKDLEKFIKQSRKYPLAMKVVSKDVIHKTDVGGVRLGLKTANEVLKAWDEITKSVKKKSPAAHIDGIVLQPMSSGKEIIIGMKRDPVFGPVIVFGLGGIFVEALKDISMRLAPVSEASASEMIEEIKGFPILHGLRGERPVDIQKIKKLIIAVSRLSLAHPEISEIDLNPIMATQKSVEVIDARIILD